MRRKGTVAVPLASALIGAVAAASVAWAAVHAPVATSSQSGAVTTRAHSTQPHVVVVSGGDDGGTRYVVVGNGNAGTQSGIPTTHTATGASGMVIP